MKKNFWKKLLSLVLVAALVVGTLHVNSRMASAAGEDHSTVTTTAGGIQITKKLEEMGTPYTNSDGRLVADGKISITLRGTENATSTTTTTSVKSTDIVFVMDISNSMKYDSKGNTNNVAESKQRIYAAKNAAKAFAEGILTDANKNNVRIGVVAFGTSAYKVQDLTNNVANVKNSITNNVKVGYSQDKGGTFIQGGLKTAETMLSGSTAQNKIIVILSDGEPTYSYSLKDWRTTGSYRILNTGHSVALYSSSQFNYNQKSGEGTDTSDKYKTRTISEAYIAKDNNIEIYSIAYDTNKNDGAKYVMQNVASKDVTATATTAGKTYFYNATSGQTTDTETAIANVMSSIVTSISETINASGSTLTDKMPSYIKAATGASAENVAINNSVYGNTVTWSNIGTLAKNDTKTINISVTVDLYAMATAYADSHDEYNSAEEVLAKMASGSNDIWFDMNEQVTFNYTDANGTNGTNTDLGTVQSKVPMKQFTAYSYTVNFYIDGELQTTTKTGYAFAGETVTFADLEEYKNDDGVKFDKTATRVEGATKSNDSDVYSVEVDSDNKEINVYYTLKSYEVKFFDGAKSATENNSKGNQIGTTQTVKYGAAATAPETADLKFSKDAFDYSFNNWDVLFNNITKDTEVVAQYSSSKVTYTVNFWANRTDSSAFATYTVDRGGKTSKPDGIPSFSGVLETGVESMKFVKWVDSSNNIFDPEETITSNKDFYADYTPVMKTFTVQFEKLDGEIATDLSQNVTYGEKATETDEVKNYSETYKTDTEIRTFTGWNYNFDTVVTGDVTIEPNYSTVGRYYTVTWVGADNKTLEKDEGVEYGKSASYDGSIPEKTCTTQYTYTFSGWDNENVVNNTISNVTSDLTIKATFKETENFFTFTFIYWNENGEEKSYTEYDVKYGTILTAPEVPNYVVSGSGIETTHRFSSWTGDSFAPVYDNGTAKAVESTANVYTVSFNYANGSESKQVADGQTVIAPSDNEVAKKSDDTYDYVFTGWKNDEGKVLTSEEIAAEPVTAPVNYVAQYEEKYINYTVNVKVFLDGTEEPSLAPADMIGHFEDEKSFDYTTISGYANGILIVGEKQYIYDTEKSETSATCGATDSTIKIYFNEAPKYQVIYHEANVVVNSENGLFTDYTNKFDSTAVLGYSNKVYAGQSFTGIPYNGKGVEENAKYYFTFDAWYLENGTKFEATTLTADVHVYAGFVGAEKSYTVNFMDYAEDYDATEKNYVTISGGSINVKYGTSIDVPEVPQKEATDKYTFTDAWETTEATLIVVADRDIKAVHTPTLKTYTVTFDPANGEAVTSSSVGYGAETGTPTAPKKTVEGYDVEFLGWAASDDPDKKIVEFPVTVKTDLDFIAVYKETIKQFTVTFCDKDESQFTYVTLTWKQNVLADAKPTYDNAVAKANAVADSKTSNVTIYHFGYWAIYNADGTTSVADLSQPVTSDLTVYARYTSCAHDDYKITYHAANYEDVVLTDSATPGKSYTVNTELAPAKASTDTINYTFLGWSYEKQYTTISDNNLVVKEIRPLAAKGGFGTPESVLREADKFVDGLLVKIGYIERDVDLYPVYASSERLYTVTFHNYDGEVIDTCTGIHYGEAATAPAATPSRASVSDATSVTTYTFKGWDKDFSKVVEDMDVYAQFDSVTTPIRIIPILPPVTPTPEPTATPTPTPVPEIIPIEEPEVPEGEPIATPTPEPTATPTPEVIEVIEEPETPEGTPDEEIDIDLDETPQGLPKTGVVAAGVLYGIGSACILLGSVLTSKFKKKEEE